MGPVALGSSHNKRRRNWEVAPYRNALRGCAIQTDRVEDWLARPNGRRASSSFLVDRLAVILFFKGWSQGLVARSPWSAARRENSVVTFRTSVVAENERTLVDLGFVEVLSMKSWAFAAIFVSVAALAACDDDGSGGDGGNGGTGGTTTSTTTSSTTTTTATGCDSGDTTGDSCGDSMSGCLFCALEGNCADELDTCQTTPDCVAFVACLDPCMDAACEEQCVTDHAEGAGVYNELSSCAVCEECIVDCDAATNCE